MLLAVLVLAVPLAAAQEQAVVASTPKSTSCANSSLFDQLGEPPATALLAAYGYNLLGRTMRDAWMCEKIDAPWAVGATALRFTRVPVQTDDWSKFSVMKVRGVDHLWVIPTSSGMLEVACVENDPHNIAAFNALLRSLPKPPTSGADWIEAGKFYMALIGQMEAIPLPFATGASSPCTADGECSLAFADRSVRPNEPYVRWTLVFDAARGSSPAELIEAEREIIQPPGE